ncbi:hypothetical protein NE857_19065 [Nocardiopsis exhalans]|uniref:Uncharacterized protein n=1 Tax=Nocardiopsis exhalans TaxID=163604 RepID=A0ABY5D2M1_9ACTN|nr:hypothetical protein [Nocardiopsis exhalans]USY17442.1 hypothetical protein NE857_19065 [Nocardiopsis exhalans]
MSFKNIFDNGENEAGSAEESARAVYERIPGARPEREGIDPELVEGIPEVERDPKIIRETSPEALKVMGGFISPMFRNTQTAAAEQRGTSEDPESTTSMASSAKDEAFKRVEVEIRDEDRPEISDEERANLKKANQKSTGNLRRTDDGFTEG